MIRLFVQTLKLMPQRLRVSCHCLDPRPTCRSPNSLVVSRCLRTGKISWGLFSVRPCNRPCAQVRVQRILPSTHRRHGRCVFGETRDGWNNLGERERTVRDMAGAESKLQPRWSQNRAKWNVPTRGTLKVETSNPWRVRNTVGRPRSWLVRR